MNFVAAQRIAKATDKSFDLDTEAETETTETMTKS